ncbi:MAG: HEAT repeat domain-containing protein [Bacteroidales bacterium]|nr:MAG: HEAT repeat domain-containing protein [Bacteroidales bacterium]
MQSVSEQKKIIRELNSEKPETILEAIRKLRQTGNPSLLPYLIMVLHRTRTEEVRNSIIRCLNDLKVQDSVNELVKAIHNEVYDTEKEILVSACWQSGLDFSNHIDTFVEIAIKDEYRLAFEAFTVVEYSISNCTSHEINSYIRRIRKKMDMADRDKKALLGEMISMLEDQKTQVE